MGKRQHKRKALAQNFLRDPGLVRRLISRARIGLDDTVYEIGPGRGIITAELARVAKKVIAVEKDARLTRTLNERFRAQPNVEIIEMDFLDYSIRAQGPYKVFSNIPFNITAAVARKLLHSRPPPTEIFLIMQSEPARKFAGIPSETQFSLIAKPYWEFRIVHRFTRTDFLPVPDVDSVLLRIHRRDRSEVEHEDARLYRDFIEHGFSGWNRNLRSAFKNVFTYTQWKRLARDLHFPANATPTGLTFEQWLGLYHGYKHLKLESGKIKQWKINRG